MTETIATGEEIEKKVYLVYSANEHLSAESFELEGVTSSLEKAHKVSDKILREYREEAKVVIKATVLDSNSFEVMEIHDFTYGLEWKKK